MKHYITVVAALLLSAVLIFNPAAKAVSLSPSWNVGYPSASAVYLSSYTVEYDMDSTDNPYPHGDYCVATYEINMPVFINPGGNDSYLNGYASAGVTFSPTTPSGWTYRASEISYESYYTENISNFCVGGSNSSASTYCVVRCLFDNYFSRNITIGLGQITARFTYTFPVTPNNLPDPPGRIPCSTSILASSTSLNGSVDPQEQGLCAVIVQAILNGINDNSLPFDDILSVLENIRTQDETNYTTIIAYLSDNDTFNSTLYTWLTTVLEDNFTDLLDDTTYISSVLNAARNLINAMNNRDSLYYPIFEAALDLANTRLQTLINLMSETPAQAASMENAINQMESKQVAINDYSLPAAGNIMGNANSYVNQGSAGMNLLATLLNQPLYILILMTVISLAFVSYLLYGKGV